jgi:hypothetical protein
MLAINALGVRRYLHWPMAAEARPDLVLDPRWDAVWWGR